MRLSYRQFWMALVALHFALIVAVLPAGEEKAQQPATAGATQGAAAGQRVFVCGHSFHVYIAKPLEDLAKAAGIVGHANLGVQFLGGSSVTQHWDLPDATNKAKQALNTGTVDVLTLSPNWIMPDPAIARFVDLALQKNPKTRVVVQMSWPAFDSATITGVILKNEDRDQRTIEQLKQAMESLRPVFEKQINDVNEKLGKQVVYVAPVAIALLALREKVAHGEAPGISKQSDLFRDALGHGKEPVERLAAYCNFATIYRKSPVGMTVFDKPANETWNKLNRLLQQLAWDAVTQYPLSGVKPDQAAAAPSEKK